MAQVGLASLRSWVTDLISAPCSPQKQRRRLDERVSKVPSTCRLLQEGAGLLRVLSSSFPNVLAPPRLWMTEGHVALLAAPGKDPAGKLGLEAFHVKSTTLNLFICTD